MEGAGLLDWPDSARFTSCRSTLIPWRAGWPQAQIPLAQSKFKKHVLLVTSGVLMSLCIIQGTFLYQPLRGCIIITAL